MFTFHFKKSTTKNQKFYERVNSFSFTFAMKAGKNCTFLKSFLSFFFR